MRSSSRFRKALAVIAPALALFVLAGSLAAQDVTLPLKAIQVKPFSQADGVGRTPEFLGYFSQGLVQELPKTKIAGQVLDEGGTVAEADAANSLLVEGTILEVKHKGMIGIVRSEVNLYRLSDRKLVKTFIAEVPYKRSPLNKDSNVGENTGRRTAYEIKRALKKL